MGMVIRHNLAAIGANNNLNSNVLGTKKATEKLSSGYQINRAGDNASGLAVSEKMRSQIGGLTQAAKNTQDGISLIQTAEGGLNETHSILQRMRDLAVQSANGTYQNDTDREAIQLEVDALKSEIDRIGDSTEYNGIKLLNGDLDGVSTGATNFGPRYGVYLSNNDTFKALNDMNASLEGSYITSSKNGVTVTLKDAATAGGENAAWSTDGNTLTLNLVKGQTYTQSQIDDLIKNAKVADGETQTGSKADVTFKLKNGVFAFEDAAGFTTKAGAQALSGKTGTSLAVFNIDATVQGFASKLQLVANNYGEDTRKITIKTDATAGKESVTHTSVDHESQGIKDGEFILHLSTGVEYSAKDIEKILAKEGLDYTVKLTDDSNPSGEDLKFFANNKGKTLELTMSGGSGVGADKTAGGGQGLTFQIGANGVEDQRVTLNVKDMRSSALGVSGVSVALQDDANKAIDTVDNAIKQVSMQRAGLGAMQNRLEHTYNNLTTTNENLTNAESSIRDTDMATEMVNYTKYNILQQASQAMLAQANQAPQSVLQLLG